MNKLTRLSYNETGWKRPTGEAAKLETGDTYNAQVGFGHEDWFFRDEWVLGGWRYAFLQGVNKSHAKLLREALPFDVTLFTILPDRSRRYVAHISDMECLSADQAQSAVDAFRVRGWLETMKREIREVKGDISALGNLEWAPELLNVRFRIENVIMLDKEVLADDPTMRLKRYMLYDWANLGGGDDESGDLDTRRLGKDQASSMPPYLRRAIDAIYCSPEHGTMQAKLLAELRAEHPAADIRCEDNFADVTMLSANGLTIFEIKTELCPRMVIRQALGQLLEYAHYGKARSGERLDFVAVGRNPLTTADKEYLNDLRKTYQLPLTYRVVNI
jgi:hypothetical protein